MADGSKIRTYKKGTIPTPIYPESIDLKITNKCNNWTLQCRNFCHESSGPNGKHAQIEWLEHRLNGLPKGTELAIGGGNVLQYPNLQDLLKNTKSIGLINNITLNINHTHISNRGTNDLLRSIEPYINAIGLSVDNNIHQYFGSFLSCNTYSCDRIVLHVILGVHNIYTVLKDTTFNRYPDILILGYKEFGLGKKYATNVNIPKEQWLFFLPRILASHNVAFDNLAIKQLGLKELIPKDIWDTYYMGDDGEYSMYIDAVKQQYAVSSTSQRFPCNDLTIKEMFNHIRTYNEQKR